MQLHKSAPSFVMMNTRHSCFDVSKSPRAAALSDLLPEQLDSKTDIWWPALRVAGALFCAHMISVCPGCGHGYNLCYGQITTFTVVCLMSESTAIVASCARIACLRRERW